MTAGGPATLKGKTILITGGTGSLGKVLTRWLLARPDDRPGKIRIFSRDEAKQHFMRLEYLHKTKATDEVIYHDFERLVEFRIGDVRDYHAVCSAMDSAWMWANARMRRVARLLSLAWTIRAYVVRAAKKTKTMMAAPTRDSAPTNPHRNPPRESSRLRSRTCCTRTGTTTRPAVMAIPRAIV